MAAQSSNEIRRINPANGAAAGAYTLPENLRAPDVAHAHGYFWGIDSSTGAMTRVSLTAPPRIDRFSPLLPAGNYGAAWTYGNGNLGFSHNGTGDVYQVAITNPSAASPTFTIVSVQPGPASANNDGAASPGLPTDLALAKSGPAPLIPGSTATFTLTVTNNGPGNASGFVVTDTVPAPLTNVASPTPGCSVAGSTVTCTSGRLEVNQSRSFTITADVPAGQFLCVTNSANVLSNDRDPSAGNNMASVESCPAAGLALDKSSPTTAVDTPGQIVTYDLTVRNTGPVTIDNIDVDDPNSSSVSCPLTVLGPGQSMVCTAEHVVSQAELDAGDPLVNVASVTGDGPSGPVPPASSPPVSIPVVQSPGLTLVKSADPIDALPNAGDDVTYTFVATNTGNVTLTGVEISDPLPGLSPLSCDAVVPATLLPGQQLTCTATYEVQLGDINAGEVVNAATTSANTPDGGTLSANDTVTIPATQTPGLVVTKVADRDHVDAAGESITYTFVATNTGNVTLSGVEISDPLPGLSPLSCDAVVPATLLPGQQLTCTATYTVTQLDLNAGFDIANTAAAAGTPPSGGPLNVNSPQVNVPVERKPALNLQKAANPGEVQAEGDSITYTFVATNTGNVTLSGVEISDPLPGLSLLSCGAVVPATLLPGQQLTCTATYDVRQSDIDAGGVWNTASVEGTPPSGSPIDVPSPPVTVLAAPSPSLVITKTSNTASFGIGDVIAYEFLVRNSGNLSISGIVVDDAKLDHPATCPRTDLAPAESMTCTGQRTAAQADVDAGEVVNTTTAQGFLPSGQQVNTPGSTVTVPSVLHTPGLAIEKRADRTEFSQIGDVVTFTFVITNTGNVTMREIAVSDQNLDSPASCPATVLAPAESTTCTGVRTITAADAAAGQLVNTASATGTTPRGDLLVSAASTVRVVYTGALGGALAFTGADVARLLVVGVALLGIGVTLQLRRPKRFRGATTALRESE